jgi:hypothetical protein
MLLLATTVFQFLCRVPFCYYQLKGLGNKFAFLLWLTAHREGNGERKGEVRQGEVEDENIPEIVR